MTRIFSTQKLKKALQLLGKTYGIEIRSAEPGLERIHQTIIIKMQILIKLSNGKRIPMNFEPDDTFLRVKQCLQEQEGIPIEKMILIFHNKENSNESRLRDYNIQAGDIMCVLQKISGG